ncbi:hypothetical protein [Streptococcus sp. NLN64]|uniref:hypothetical protein n=1 Tax=Streptococcus sp. NLN64 TaxID=2822799 RepID=UPI0018CAB054|nr:hypothetical protein [Streptococcus sp. NLN64]MBG9366508.1 hypothetical protein [Streptococcus sp. NLN64]
MNIVERLKDLFSNFLAKLILLFLFITGTYAVFSCVTPHSGSPINVLMEIPFQRTAFIFSCGGILSCMLLLLVHEVFKFIKIESKGDVRFSTIVAISFFIFITLRNLLILLSVEQIDLVLMIFGMPFFVSLPRLYKFILGINKP